MGPHIGQPQFRNVPILTAWNAHRDAINKVCTERFAREHNVALHEFYSVDKLTSSHSSQSAKAENQKREPPILALFTEFPSNPLLRSPNLPRLRALADKYDFLIVVDETVGNFVNVSVLPYADIVVSSLTKVFGGDSNVMGGR